MAAGPFKQEWITVKELALITGCSEKYIRQRISGRKIWSKRWGGKRLIPMSYVEEFRAMPLEGGSK